MTAQEEHALLRDYLETCARLAAGWQRAVDRVAPMMPVEAAGLDTMLLDDENVILAYLKRYEQFEDALGRTIKTVAQIMALGKFERLTPRDVANKAEAFGIVDDAARWGDAVRARNALAHEYPLRPDKRAAQINNAWAANPILLEAWAGLQRFIDQEGLLT